jgi:hypothetical protein
VLCVRASILYSMCLACMFVLWVWGGGATERLSCSVRGDCRHWPLGGGTRHLHVGAVSVVYIARAMWQVFVCVCVTCMFVLWVWGGGATARLSCSVRGDCRHWPLGGGTRYLHVGAVSVVYIARAVWQMSVCLCLCLMLVIWRDVLCLVYTARGPACVCGSIVCDLGHLASICALWLIDFVFDFFYVSVFSLLFVSCFFFLCEAQWHVMVFGLCAYVVASFNVCVHVYASRAERPNTGLSGFFGTHELQQQQQQQHDARVYNA